MSSPKRTPGKRGSSPKRGQSPAKGEKPWIPAPCKTSKNRYTWAGSKAKLNVTQPLSNSTMLDHDTSQIHIVSDDEDYSSLLPKQSRHHEPSLMENVTNYRNRVADLSNELDFLKTQADLREKEKEIDLLRNDLNKSLTDTFVKDREIGTIQEDLLHTELENERLRSSIRQMQDVDISHHVTQTKLQTQREALLKRLVQAEADSVAAKREMALLHNSLKTLKVEKDVCQEDTENLERQREVLLKKCAEAEHNNMQLHREVRENELKLEDSSKLQEQHNKLLARLTQQDTNNRELKNSLADMDKQISQLSRQIAVEKEEAEAYKHLQRTSEMSRSKTEEALHSTMGDNARLERRIIALESDLELEKREHHHTKGLLAGTKDKSHSDKEALRDKVRTYRDRALQNDEALEAVSAQLEAKSATLRDIEAEAEILTNKLDKSIRDNTELTEELTSLRRKLYLAEENKDELEHDLQREVNVLKNKVENSSQNEKSLEIKNKQLKISLDSLTDQLKEKDQELSSQASIKDAESEGLKHDVDYFKDRLKCAEELLQRYKEDNHMLHQRCEIAERERGAMQHGNHMELEKIRQDYEAKLNELSLLPEKLRSAEAKSAEADGTKIILQNQVADQNRTINDLNRKIDVLSEQIGKLKDKFHSVNEDNIELNNKSQSHERKMMEADLHNKNLMDLVNKKDDTIEQQQPSAIEVDGKVSPSTTDNNASESEEKKKKLGLNESESETETESTASSEEEVDWSEMLKNAEANRERLGLDDVQLSDGESSVDEEGNRYIKKKATNGFSTHDMINRMATNELLGYDEFGRPISGKGAYKGVLGGKSHKNRAMLFGMDNGKRSKKIGSNNRGAGGKDRSRSGGRRNKGGKGGNMALLGF